MNWARLFARGVEVREMTERDARNALRSEFGIDDGFADSQPDSSNWALLEHEPVQRDSRSPRSVMRSEMKQ